MLCNENEGAYLKFEGNCTTLSVVTQQLKRKEESLRLEQSLILKCECTASIGHFTVMYLVTKPLIWSEAEGDPVVMETSI